MRTYMILIAGALGCNAQAGQPLAAEAPTPASPAIERPEAITLLASAVTPETSPVRPTQGDAPWQEPVDLDGWLQFLDRCKGNACDPHGEPIRRLAGFLDRRRAETKDFDELWSLANDRVWETLRGLQIAGADGLRERVFQDAVRVRTDQWSEILQYAGGMEAYTQQTGDGVCLVHPPRRRGGAQIRIPTEGEVVRIRCTTAWPIAAYNRESEDTLILTGKEQGQVELVPARRVSGGYVLEFDVNVDRLLHGLSLGVGWHKIRARLEIHPPGSITITREVSKRTMTETRSDVQRAANGSFVLNVTQDRLDAMTPELPGLDRDE